jgi:protein O-mannosyl-transferase
MSKAKTTKKSGSAPLTVVASKSNDRLYLWGILIFLFTFILYSNTLQHKFVLDDFGALADNWVIKKGISGIPIILNTSYRYGINMLTDNLYRPLSQVMFAIEWQMVPKNPTIHHFFNVFFYALSCWLLFVVLRKYFSKVNPIIPLIITILYAVHPLHTEVVANIKGRDEIMSFLFLMLTLLTMHQWFTKRNVISLILALVCYFLAFMSKEGVITMLAVFPLMGWYFTSSSKKDIILSSVLMIIPAVTYIVIRSVVLSKYGSHGETAIVDNFLNAAPDKSSYLATAVMLLGKYVWMLFVPTPLVSDYSFNQIPIVGWADWRVLLSLLIFTALAVYSVFQIKKRSPIVFGILFFLITMSIYSNILMPIGSSFAERFMFLPSLGFCIAIVFLCVKLFKISEVESSNESRSLIKSSPVFVGVFAVLVLLYGGKTIVRAAEWKDQYTLFGKDIKRSPNSAHLRYYWGLALRDRAIEQKDQNLQDQMMLSAIEQFNKAVEIYPSYPDCYEQLGLAYYRVKDLNKSMDNYQKALALNNTKAVTWSNMGIIYFEQGNYPKAFEHYSKSLSLDSNYADAYFNMGSTLGMMGRYDEAIASFEKCIKFDPENAKAHQFIGMTYQNLHRDAEAKPWFEKAAILEQKKATEKAIK